MDALEGRYGSPVPPREDLDPFESLIAALLARSAEPRKVAAALDALRDAGLLEPGTLAEADEDEVADALRDGRASLAPKGIAPARRLARLIVERYGSSAEALMEGSPGAPATESLREELASLNGIGRATADALLLHALGRAVYPVDRATYRVLARHGWIEPSADYEEARAVVERLSPDAPADLERLSRWMEQVGRDDCKPGSPRCERCPLRPFLPEGGPWEPGE